MKKEFTPVPSSLLEQVKAHIKRNEGLAKKALQKQEFPTEKTEGPRDNSNETVVFRRRV